MEDLQETEASWWRSPRLIAALACFMLGAAVLAAGFAPRLLATEGLSSSLTLEQSEPWNESTTADDPRPDLVVYVSGAVLAPDVYRLPAGARVKDAVVAAGGLRPDAAAERVNLAEPLADAAHIHVPAQAAPGAPGEQAATGADQGLIDLNSASPTQLEDLPGVGKVLAERIVAHRDAQGPFKRVEGLREVSGIGASLYDRIAPLVSVGP